jgi:hypothetical protein
LNKFQNPNAKQITKENPFSLHIQAYSPGGTTGERLRENASTKGENPANK